MGMATAAAAAAAASAFAARTEAATVAFPPTVTVSADDFVSRAQADSALVRFLGMRTPTSVATPGSDSGSESDLTLRKALRKLGGVGGFGRSGTKSAKSRLRWEDIEGLLFEPYDPTRMLGDPPSTVSIGGSSGQAGGVGGEQQEEEEVRTYVRVYVCACVRQQLYTRFFLPSTPAPLHDPHAS